jgi:hypothetical protein
MLNIISAVRLFLEILMLDNSGEKTLSWWKEQTNSHILQPVHAPIFVANINVFTFSINKGGK